MSRKPGSGKRPGAGSFKVVTVGELRRVLQDSAPVPVSRRFCEMLQMKGRELKATTENLEALASPEIAVKVNTFGQEEESDLNKY